MERRVAYLVSSSSRALMADESNSAELCAVLIVHGVIMRNEGNDHALSRRKPTNHPTVLNFELKSAASGPDIFARVISSFQGQPNVNDNINKR